MGFLDPISEVLGTILAAVYSFVPSFGISIIILTVIVMIITFPLTLRQTRSSRAMQEIQPQIKQLQKKHKDEPEKLQKEMLALYKEKGVNPAGCLFPMLIQMPIWFALFQLLRMPEDYLDPSTELAQSIGAGDTGFLGVDLTESASMVISAGGGVLGVFPYVVMAVLMVGSQFIQQRQMTPPSAGQDRQARQMQNIMKFLPILFGYFAFIMPAGLVLYWVTSNLFRIGQGQIIIKMEGKPGQPPAEKAEREREPNPKPKKPQGSTKKRNRRRRK
ncbi:MAG: YidC/Oxa1 family membrane protein insertase [Nitrospiraceae bacterium]